MAQQQEERHETQAQRESATAWFRTDDYPYHRTRAAQVEDELQDIDIGELYRGSAVLFDLFHNHPARPIIRTRPNAKPPQTAFKP